MWGGVAQARDLTWDANADADPRGALRQPLGGRRVDGGGAHQQAEGARLVFELARLFLGDLDGPVVQELDVFRCVDAGELEQRAPRVDAHGFDRRLTRLRLVGVHLQRERLRGGEHLEQERQAGPEPGEHGAAAVAH